MAKQFGGAFANYYGKIGNVVARIRQGRTILSIYQPQVHNPKTEDQEAQRQKFTLMTQFLAIVAAAVKIGFHSLDGYKTGNPFSAAVGYNLKGGGVSGIYPNQELDFSKIKLAIGNVDMPYSPSATADGTILSLTWADNSGMGDALATDKVAVVAVNDLKGQAVMNLALAERADRNGTLTLPTAWTGDNVNVWMFIVRANGNCSDSAHLASLPL